jgi:poly-gamma-glutamate synthesis protein (capsule biosynthesis protein)
MKRLYTIFLILLFSACNGVRPPESAGQLAPTIPQQWLTKPPTPAITRQSGGYVVESVEPPPTASPGPIVRDEDELAEAKVSEAEDPNLEIEPSPTPIISLPRLFGRLWTVSADPGVPQELINAARAMAAEQPDDFLWVEPGSLPTDLTLTLDDQQPLAEWLYVVAAPFATLEDQITEEELKELWLAREPTDRRLLLRQDVAGTLRGLWGEPGVNVGVESNEDLKDALWAQRPSLTVLPYHELTPDLKVLRLDGQSPFDPDFLREEYPLQTVVSLDGEEEALAAFLGAWEGAESNYDPAKVTTLAMTGVTALVRATATQMEIDGILSPAVDVGPVLRAADFAHISNEVSFTPNCPEPNPVGGTSFCSQDEYFALLEEIGTDIVELTGNHLNDWGAEYVGRSIDMYEAAGMETFGGGRDAEDAAKPLIIDHNGNRIALVGCNFFGPAYAWATTTTAGSRACGPEFFEEIQQLEADGYVVIATQQYTEYYQYPPTPDQERDFRAIADAGAAAVSGSQGHHAQGFDFYNDAFIHYGLGNLFFDQMDMMGTRQAFVDTYTIYDGRLINVDLWTGLIENFSTPREMTTAEREEALRAVFEASGW